MTDTSIPDIVIPQPAPHAAGLARWGKLIGPAISLAILTAVLVQLRQLNWRLVLAIVPGSAAIWAVFLASYFAGPVADWVIFRRLWGIPLSGLEPLVKKLIGNELLLGYVGEVYFYEWARGHVKMTGSPFGAVKDVAILSALAGNITTIAMLAIAWPLIAPLGFGANGRVLALSIGVVLLTSGAIMLFRNGLFSLPRRQLWLVFGVHTARIVVGAGLSALTWHLILPGVSIGTWLLLSTIRLLLARLPFIPNKDLAFAGITALLVGSEVQTGIMIAMLSMLIVALHVILFIALTVVDLLRRDTRA